MLLRSAIRIGSVVHHTRQWATPACAFTRQSPEQGCPHAHFRLRFRSDLSCAMAEAPQVVVDLPTLSKDDFAQRLDLKALRVQAKQCQSLMKKFAG